MNSVQHEKYEVMLANQKRLDGFRRSSLDKQRLSHSILLEVKSSMVMQKSTTDTLFRPPHNTIKTHLDNIYQ